ncbi:MAG TPA: c-type cytochrome [Vicinamibacteria bacterium]
MLEPKAVAVALVLAAVPAAAQIPDKFTNLQVLPKDIARPELVRTMRSWAGELGVRCAHCHVGPDDLQGMDFAVDTKPTKRAAREMIRLVQHINATVVPALPAREGARDGVSCYTCHRREARPPLPLFQELARVEKERGGAAAVERYRELRRAGETAGKYDFGPEALAMTVFTLSEQKRAEGALAVARLGVEQYPSRADSYVVLAQVQLQGGDAAGAKESFRKALALDPNHPVAQRRLKELEASPKP